MTRQLHPNHTAVPKNFCRLPSGYGVVKIGVSGSADLGLAGMDAFEKAKELGREISRQGAIITTGATTGFPMYAAMGAKDECGFSVGLSPASTEREHVESYKLPLDFMDVIIYTGFGYAGRDLMFVRSADAMVIGPGRIGTYNEFSVAFEDRRPIGILEGSWETDEIIKRIVESANRPNDRLFFESDPKRLVARLIKLVLEEKQETNMVYRNPDGVAGKEVDYIL